MLMLLKEFEFNGRRLVKVKVGLVEACDAGEIFREVEEEIP